MASQRILWPAGGSSAAYGTDTALTTPGNVSAADSVVTGAQAVDSTHSIGERYGNWGWNSIIPAGAIITDVQLEYKYKGGRTAGTLVGHTFARISGTDQTDHTDSEAATFPTGVTVGPFSVFADRSWTRADLLDGTFEMVIRATSVQAATAWTNVGWDYIAVTVSWTVPSTQTHPVRRTTSVARYKSRRKTIIIRSLVQSPPAGRRTLLVTKKKRSVRKRFPQIKRGRSLASVFVVRKRTIVKTRRLIWRPRHKVLLHALSAPTPFVVRKRTVVRTRDLIWRPRRKIVRHAPNFAWVRPKKVIETRRLLVRPRKRLIFRAVSTPTVAAPTTYVRPVVLVKVRRLVVRPRHKVLRRAVVVPVVPVVQRPRPPLVHEARRTRRLYHRIILKARSTPPVAPAPRQHTVVHTRAGRQANTIRYTRRLKSYENRPRIVVTVSFGGGGVPYRVLLGVGL